MATNKQPKRISHIELFDKNDQKKTKDRLE